MFIISAKTMHWPVWKIDHFLASFNPCFYSLDMLIFYVERYEALFFNVSYVKRRAKKIW